MYLYCLNLNLTVCRKRTQNQRRINQQKRKAPHKKKRIQRKKHAKIKNIKSPVNSWALYMYLSSVVSPCKLLFYRFFENLLYFFPTE